MREKVQEVIDKIIQPALAMHGGGVQLMDVTEGVVKVRLLGACSGCPGAQMTLKAFVEQQIKSRVPEVKSVEATF
jgi:Fe-S cluster biogenesis protein NfuA